MFDNPAVKKLLLIPSNPGSRGPCPFPPAFQGVGHGCLSAGGRLPPSRSGFRAPSSKLNSVTLLFTCGCSASARLSSLLCASLLWPQHSQAPGDRDTVVWRQEEAASVPHKGRVNEGEILGLGDELHILSMGTNWPSRENIKVFHILI